MAATDLLAPVPSAEDYTVSAELWQRLEDEVKYVSGRIARGDELTPDDVVNVRKLKSQVDSYIDSFNRAMRDAMGKYKKMEEKMLTEIGYDAIEQFVAMKRQEQSAIQNSRIASKMDTLKMISDGLLERTERLKDVPVSKELLPAFMARFPKVQSGAKSSDIKDWNPYFSIMAHTVTVMDVFFCDPNYADAAMLPLYSGTIRELLAYAKDGNEAHLANVKVKYQEDQHYIHEEKLRRSIKSKADGISHIRRILEDIDGMDGISEAAQKVRTEQAWGEISQIVRLVNNI